MRVPSRANNEIYHACEATNFLSGEDCEIEGVVVSEVKCHFNRLKAASFEFNGRRGLIDWPQGSQQETEVVCLVELSIWNAFRDSIRELWWLGLDDSFLEGKQVFFAFIWMSFVPGDDGVANFVMGFLEHFMTYTEKWNVGDDFSRELMRCLPKWEMTLL